MIDLSVVVVTWNTRELALECLESVSSELSERAPDPELGPSLRVEVVVVDNGSTDGTADALRARFPSARVLALPENQGFAGGANRGLREVRGRHVLLLNSDARLTRGAAERCVRFLDAHADVGIVGPQLLYPDGSRQNSIHNFPIVTTELVPKGVFQILWPRRFPSRRSTGDAPLDVEALVGAALFFRRDLLRHVGPLPEEYFFFLEETDWCRRAGQQGWRVVYLPSAQVVHVSGASSKRKSPALTRIEYHRSLYRFYRKFRGPGWMGTVLAVRFSKSLFYVVTQAPLALAGGRHARRWWIHLRVLGWHLRGCPDDVGLRTFDPARRDARADGSALADGARGEASAP